MNIKAGDYVKVKTESRVFKVCGFTAGRKAIPDGWLIEKDGGAVNPAFCEKYNGATSVLGG